jgi:hypothetical protein
MPKPILYAIADTPTHPDFTALYRRLGFDARRIASQRRAIAELKKEPPAVVVGEFVNAFHTYYQATNISNLDVFLQSLSKYAPDARVIVVVERKDLALANQLAAIHQPLTLVPRPCSEATMEELLGLGG